jgi:hypothetical protein
LPIAVGLDQTPMSPITAQPPDRREARLPDEADFIRGAGDPAPIRAGNPD